MKIFDHRTLIVVLVFLAGCARAGTSMQAPATQALIQQPAAPLDETSRSATSFPQAEPTDNRMALQEAPGATKTESQARAALLLQPTLIPCSGGLTSPNQEGPYYTPGSPQRNSLIDAGMPGTPILIMGRVFDQNCTSIARAKLDFWQANVSGEYDNVGYRLRGYVISDQNGVYSIESIAPGLYTGRPAHIHVKIFAPDGRELLTTQLYFPGSEGSADVLTAPDLLVQYQGTDKSGRKLVFFNFAVQY